MTLIIYILLNVIMYYCLYYSGKKISRLNGEVSFFKVLRTGWLGILAFTLNEGLRFGRGIDYNLYARSFYYGDRFETMDVLFRNIGYIIRNFGMGWQEYVLLMSFTLIVAGSIFIAYNFRTVASFCLPLFGFFVGYPAETTARWAFAYSFALIGFTYYLLQFGNSERTKLNYIKYILFSFIGFFIHYGIFLLAVAYFAISLFNKPLCKPIVSTIIFICVGLFFESSVMGRLSNYINIITSLNESRSEYLMANMDVWLTSGSNVLKFRSFPLLINCVIFILTNFIGYIILKQFKDKRLICVYNIFIIGFMLSPVGSRIELFSRINQNLIYMEIVIMAYAIKYYVLDSRLSLSNLRKVLSIALLLVVSYNAYTTYFKRHDYDILYTWDANNKKSLNLKDTYYRDMKRGR